jgi:hypothetical protein
MRVLKEVQEELRACLVAVQETVKSHFNKKVRATPDRRVGDEVWRNSQNISTTRPCPKLDHWWLGLFPIECKISNSAYRLTLPSSMKGIHPVFHVSILRKFNIDTIKDRKQERPAQVQVNGKEEWEVEGVLDCRKKGQKMEYHVHSKGFGPEENSWEPERNLNHCGKLVADFNSTYPDAARKHWRRRRMK